jgi:hypothetical protein
VAEITYKRQGEMQQAVLKVLKDAGEELQSDLRELLDSPFPDMWTRAAFKGPLLRRQPVAQASARVAAAASKGVRTPGRAPSRLGVQEVGPEVSAYVWWKVSRW